jgi:hypothetical protein
MKNFSKKAFSALNKAVLFKVSLESFKQIKSLAHFTVLLPNIFGLNDFRCLIALLVLCLIIYYYLDYKQSLLSTNAS